MPNNVVSLPLVTGGAPTSDSSLPSFLQQAYLDAADALKLTQDCWDGLKNCKREYLKPELKEPQQAYRDRVDRSVFDNRFEPALRGYAGLLSEFTFLEDTPNSILDAQDNIDGTGNDFVTFWNGVDVMALRDGWCAILVEAPPLDLDIQSNADLIQSGRRPYLVAIDRRNILNWRLAHVNGQSVLQQVTIREIHTEPEGRFGSTQQTYYRVLVPGGYTLYQIDASGRDAILKIVERGETSLDVIPLLYYSVSSSDWFAGSPPFLNLAELNVLHYIKRSQLDEVLRKCNLPTPVRKAFRNADELRKAPPLTIGPNSVVDIPLDGDFYFAEPSGTAIAATQSDIERLEEAMNKVSLSFLTGDSTNRTATEVLLNSAQTQANLREMSARKASVIESCFQLWIAYTGEQTVGGIRMDERILQAPPTYQDVQTILNAIGVQISKKLGLQMLQERGWLPEDLDIDEELRLTGDEPLLPLVSENHIQAESQSLQDAALNYKQTSQLNDTGVIGVTPGATTGMTT